MSALRPFHRFDIRKETMDKLFPGSPWLQNSHRTLLYHPLKMVDLFSELITKEYFLGDQDEVRFGWSRLQVEELPDGMFFIRVRTGGRDCHFFNSL